MSVAVALASVQLRDPVLISDLHLSQGQPRTLQRFEQLAAEVGMGRRRELVILGDLFEYWPGDEEATRGVGAAVTTTLRSLTAGGTPVYLMHGNRDMLLGDRFARATGAALLADPCLTVLGDTPTMLAHGDAYCTLDKAYQAFRRWARDPLVQRLFLGLPLALRHALMGQVRQASEAGKKKMAAPIMDVTPQAIEQALGSAGVRRMIHGHTHRPARHVLEVDGHPAERWVLPDWDFDVEPARGGYMQVSGGKVEMIDLA